MPPARGDHPQVFLDSDARMARRPPGDLVRFGAGTWRPVRARSADYRLARLAGRGAPVCYDLVTRGARPRPPVIGYELLAGDLGAWRPLGARWGWERSTPEREQASAAGRSLTTPELSASAMAGAAARFRVWAPTRPAQGACRQRSRPAPSHPTRHRRPMIDWQQPGGGAGGVLGRRSRRVPAGASLAARAHDCAVAGAGLARPHLAPAEVLADPRLDFLTDKGGALSRRCPAVGAGRGKYTWAHNRRRCDPTYCRAAVRGPTGEGALFDALEPLPAQIARSPA